MLNKLLILLVYTLQSSRFCNILAKVMIKNKTTRFCVTDYLKSEKDIAEYLKAVLEEGDNKLLVVAKKDIAKARRMNKMAKLRNISPGEILVEEFLKPMSISVDRLAKETKISKTLITRIVNNKCKISNATAVRFSKYFDNSPQFWLGIQNQYDLEEENELHLAIKKKQFEIVPLTKKLKATYKNAAKVTLKRISKLIK